MTVVVPRWRGVAVITVPVWGDDYNGHYHERHFIVLRFRLSMMRRRSASRKQECPHGESQETASTHNCGLYLCVVVAPFNGMVRSFGVVLLKPLCFPFPLRWWRTGGAGRSCGGRMDFLAARRSCSTALSQVLKRMIGIFPCQEPSLRTCERLPGFNDSQPSSRLPRPLDLERNRFESNHRVLLNFF
jgi:hypothetical protein